MSTEIEKLAECNERIIGVWESENAKMWYKFKVEKNGRIVTIHTKNEKVSVGYNITYHKSNVFIDFLGNPIISDKIEYLSDAMIVLRNVNTLTKHSLYKREALPEEFLHQIDKTPDPLFNSPNQHHSNYSILP